MEADLGNYTATTLDQLEGLIRSPGTRQPELIKALLGQTGLTLDPPP
jgi:hypothetical protein